MHEEISRVGARLRAARQSRGLTLAELAEAADMSPSTLSRLESGKRQASLELLVPLTRRLGVRIDDLVQPEPADPRVRRPSRRLGELVMTPLAPEGSALQAYRIVYPPSAEKPVPKTHDGYEWLYVLTGRLALTLDDHTHELARGEAAEFDTRTPHSMAAAGNRPATVLSIFNASGERMHTHTPQ